MAAMSSTLRHLPLAARSRLLVPPANNSARSSGYQGGGVRAGGGVHQLERLAAIVARENERQNLVSRKELESANGEGLSGEEVILKRHIGDSLCLLEELDALLRVREEREQQTIRLVDVGTGGGFPGLVVAVERPEWEVVLMDATRKKIDFVTAAAAELGLRNVRGVWTRVEEMGQNHMYREQHSLVVARAVAPMAVLAEYCLPLVEVGGFWVAPKGAKGPELRKELGDAEYAIEKLGGKLVDVKDSPESDYEDGSGRCRTHVIVSKTRGTPKIYPRQNGVPRKSPL